MQLRTKLYDFIRFTGRYPLTDLFNNMDGGMSPYWEIHDYTLSKVIPIFILQISNFFIIDTKKEKTRCPGLRIP